MDVTNKASILAARDVIKEKEGKLHILVNKSVDLSTGLMEQYSQSNVVRGKSVPFLHSWRIQTRPKERTPERLDRRFSITRVSRDGRIYTKSTFSPSFLLARLF